jgi:hypothetical protein
LARRLRRHEDGQRPVLADPDHAVHRQATPTHQVAGATSPWSIRETARNPGHHEGDREVRIDKAHECMEVYKTTDMEHPGVKMVMEQGEIQPRRPVKVLSTGGFQETYGEQLMTPARKPVPCSNPMGWSKVAAFQTRNPMHRSHEYLAKVAIETMRRRAGAFPAR